MLRAKTVTGTSIAAAAFLAASQMAGAATLTQSYYSVQSATNSGFTSGLVTYTTAQIAAGISIPTGSYFRFGLSDLVTNNPDNLSGGAFDTANQNGSNGNNPLPTNLGLSQIGYTVNSSDVLGTSFAPVQVASTPLNSSTAAITSVGGVNFASKGNGDVTGGLVGSVFSISANNGQQDATTPGGVANLGFDSTPTVVNSKGQTVAAYTFQNLSYHAVATSMTSVTVTPTINMTQLQYYTFTSAGAPDATSGPSNQTNFFGAGDSVGSIAPLVVTITAPTAGGPVVTLSTTNPGGTPNGTITVTRFGAGSYTPGSAVFSPAITSGFVTVNGFVTPDQEAYGLNLTSTNGTQAAINDLVTYLNANASGGTVVARGAATLTAAQTRIFAGLPAIDQIAFISTTPTASSPEFFSFNFSGFSTAFPADGTFSVNSITAVPEPTSIAGLALGIGGLLASRRKRVA